MNIGFDFDGVFVDKPPLVPKSFIEWLFREHGTKKLAYRVPGNIEQMIRSVSHIHLLRPALKENIGYVHRLKKKYPQLKLYLISARFGFLSQRTDYWMKKEKLTHLFEKVYLNTTNQQPHIFKEGVLKKITIDHFVDDDLPLLEYLSQKQIKTTLYWISTDKKKGINPIVKLNHLFEIENYL